MSFLDKIKKVIKRQDREAYGEDVEGSENQGVDESYKGFFGHKPIKGETIADETQEAERSRRGIEPHEDKK